MGGRHLSGSSSEESKKGSNLLRLLKQHSFCRIASARPTRTNLAQKLSTPRGELSDLRVCERGKRHRFGRQPGYSQHAPGSEQEEQEEQGAQQWQTPWRLRRGSPSSMVPRKEGHMS